MSSKLKFILWRTDEVRLRKPTVLDEVEMVCTTLEHPLSNTEVYRDLEKAVKRVYHTDNIKIPSFIRFGSWIGGDRDGNPFVTPDITREAVICMQKPLYMNTLDVHKNYQHY